MFLAILIGTLVVILVFTLVVSLLITRDWFGQRVAQRQTLFVAGIFVSVTIIGIALNVLLPTAWRKSLWITLQLALAVLSWTTITIAFIRRKRFGSILLDLGPMPGHQLLMIASGILLFTVLGDLFFNRLLDHNFSTELWAEMLFRLSLSSLFLFQARSRVQIRQAGILYQQFFIPWQKISTYGWEQDHPTTLTIHVQSWIPFAREHNLAIPVQYRERVNALLAQPVSPYTRHNSSLA